MAEKHDIDDSTTDDGSSDKNKDGSRLNRRKVIQMMGGSAAATTGIGVLSGTTSAQRVTEFEHEEVDGEEADKYRKKALETKELRELQSHIEGKFEAQVDRSDTTVYRISDRGEQHHAVEFPVTGSKHLTKSSVAIGFQNNSVSYNKAVVFETNRYEATSEDSSEKVTSISEFEVSPQSVGVKSKDVPLPEEQLNSQNEDVTIQSCMGDCTTVLKRLCPYLCGLGAAVFCGAIGYVFPLAGIACAAFYGLYCVEIQLLGACYYTNSARGDCRRFIC